MQSVRNLTRRGEVPGLFCLLCQTQILPAELKRVRMDGKNYLACPECLKGDLTEAKPGVKAARLCSSCQEPGEVNCRGCNQLFCKGCMNKNDDTQCVYCCGAMGRNW